jgi:hypothetical protein
LFLIKGYAMAHVLAVTEYPDEGIAIIEDTAGKYLVSKSNPNIIPIPEKVEATAWFSLNRPPCALLQTRAEMMM